MLRLNRVPSTQVVWFQELNPVLIKCYKEDYFLIMMPIFIDWVLIMMR